MVCARLLQVRVLGVALRQRTALRVTMGGLGLALPQRRAPALRLGCLLRLATAEALHRSPGLAIIAPTA
eukprot:6561669-Lingulodinium_polyedra.AAC.1